ncbi:MAG: rod shape-determining protein RodA [Candidatus Giovannonibacteria bacterium]|nr:MAG: rod shape-determining protein RodA [Candidatus Giovannonibacteria bacterium]
MMRALRMLGGVDWVLILSVFALVVLGLATMKFFGPPAGAAEDYFFSRQLVWVLAGVTVFLISVLADWSFLKTNSIFLLILYFILVAALLFLIFYGKSVRGASSWFQIKGLSIEPVELIKPALVLVLAKYFSKRHIEIARFARLAVSFIYVAIPAVLVATQPDMGSAIVLVAIWLGMALAGGIKMRQLFFLLLSGAVLGLILWSFVLLPYQKTRIISFFDPARDARGAGYHALQSVIAIGSGGLFGKGVGYGTQSRLEFLPEHETDFIFAAFAEEWGFVGVLFLLFFLGVALWRILLRGIYGESNFEKLYAAGLAIFIFFQSAIHIGMNSGLLPITGLGMPFLSYGGSSLVSLFWALGILESFSIRKRGIFLGSEGRFSEGILGA